MSSFRYVVLFVAAGVCAFGAGYAFWKLQLGDPEYYEQQRQIAAEEAKRKAMLELAGGQPESLQVGQTAPSFQLPDIQGQLRSLDEWQGQTIILNFWATWCPPCREEMPLLEAINNEQPDVAVVTVAIDQLEAIQRFVDEYSLTFPVLYGSQRASDLVTRFGSQAGTLPYTVVLDHDMTLRYQHSQILTRELIESWLQNLTETDQTTAVMP